MSALEEVDIEASMMEPFLARMDIFVWVFFVLSLVSFCFPFHGLVLLSEEEMMVGEVDHAGPRRWEKS